MEVVINIVMEVVFHMVMEVVIHMVMEVMEVVIYFLWDLKVLKEMSLNIFADLTDLTEVVVYYFET